MSENAGIVDWSQEDALQLQRRVSRVALLHYRVASPSGYFCDECSYDWPCDTMRALTYEPTP
jgi:hypothetical protein